MPRTPSTPQDRSERPPKLILPTDKKFERRFNELQRQRQEVFGDGISRPSKGPFKDYSSFAEAYDGNDSFGHHFAGEVATMLMEKNAKLWPSQEVQLFELMQAPLVQSFRENLHAVLCPSGAGTGKTRVAGKIPEAVRRMNERGVYDKGVLALVRRRAMILPQTMDTEARADLLLGNRGLKDRERMEKGYIQQWLRMVGVYADDKELVTALLELRTRKKDEQIKKEAIQILEAAGLKDKVFALPAPELFLEDLVQVLSGRSVVLRSTDAEDFETLRFSKEGGFLEGGGDLLGSLPQSYRESSRVHIHSSLENIWNADATELPGKDTRLAVFSRTSLLQHRSQVHIAQFLKTVGVIILDEAEGVHPESMGRLVTDIGYGDEPDMVYASTASTKKQRPGYETELSYLSTKTAINRPEQILRKQRLVRVDTPENKLYPSGSYEAADQMLDFYAQRLSLPDKLKIEQPTEGHQLVVVDSRLVPYVSHMLRGITAGSGAQVRTYASNKDEYLNMLLQQALNDPKAPTVIVVSGPDAVMDSFDWRALRSTFMCVHDSRYGEGTERLGGRQMHTMMDPSYVVYQQFAKPETRNFLPHIEFSDDAGFPDEGPFEFVQGSTFLGQKAVAADQKSFGRHPQRALTTAITKRKEFEEVFSLEEGTFPPKLEDQRQHAVISTIVHPRLAVGQTVFTTEYAVEFAKSNGISKKDLFLEKLGDSAASCASVQDALIALERAVHFTRAAEVRQPRASYR